MNKIGMFLKKHWRTLLLMILCIVGIAITIFVVAGVPLIINWAFTEPARHEWFAVDWEAKDALDYYGSALGFIGTVIFSGLALWQNHKIQQANDKHTQVLENMEKVKNAPHLAVHAIGSTGKTSNLRIQIVNTSENIAESLYAYGFAIIDETGVALWRDDGVVTLDYLISERTFTIGLENPGVESVEHQFVFDLMYNDKFGNKHSCKAVGSFEQGKGLPRFKLTEL